jgi:SagB-type dehydrogenase family enzyme
LRISVENFGHLETSKSGARHRRIRFPNQMNRESAPLHATELDSTNFVEWRERMIACETDAAAIEPRTYPAYPRWPLLRVAARVWPPLDQSLIRRRSTTVFSTAIPSKRALSRLLWLAHGICEDRARGPVPSAGGLQALEIYLVSFESSWLPEGCYHFDRRGNYLSQIISGASRQEWIARVPSLVPTKGGAFLFVLVGDYSRVEAKYGARALRFLLIEAGHLAQNLCLLAESLNLCALPLGGFFEREIAHSLTLPCGDEVLYLLLCGKPEK